MASRTSRGSYLTLGLGLALGVTLSLPSAADATPRQHHGGDRQVASRLGGFRTAGYRHAFRHGHGRAYAGLQCVPYARTVSGIELAGNAWTWWDEATGVYARGARPEQGSVLAFRSNGRMRLGHVAVVADVINSREIEIDHANWGGPGAVSKGTVVVDVSANNDWTAVRVEMGRNGEFGSVYPTYGFIYDRADTGVMVAAAHATPAPELNPPPADLRGYGERDGDEPVEVAEVPQHHRHAHHAARHKSRS